MKWKLHKNKEGQRFIITAGKGGPSKQDCKASYIDSDATGHLLATAPEMLSQLKALVPFIAQNLKTGEERDSIYYPLVNLIAKAEGKAS